MDKKSPLYLVVDERLCAFDGCINITYADEPYCFMHSADDGYVEEYN